MSRKNKNISKNIHNGTIVQTRDEYFSEQGNYRKKGYENKGNYRKAVVVDSNRNDELAVVKLYSHSGKELKKTVSRYKPFVETKDNINMPIKVGHKFIKTNKRLSKENLTTIKKDCYSSRNVSYVNRKKTRKLKGR
jgi:hypothetical protein